ncbi:MAG TPA: ribbon-helix-helix protein, CopG family [Patescibacteria group bacterium]|nr:ribbon-helix-helix protein, CopG family [Patescibacteria group bacterium]
MATKTLNIALDAKLLKEIDKVAKQEMSSRSEYFRRLALVDLTRRRQWTRLLDSSNRKGRVLGIKSEQEIYAALEN